MYKNLKEFEGAERQRRFNIEVITSNDKAIRLMNTIFPKVSLIGDVCYTYPLCFSTDTKSIAEDYLPKHNYFN